MNVVLPTVFGPRSQRECPCVAADSRGSFERALLWLFTCALWARCKKRNLSQWPSSFHLRRVVSHLAASSTASQPASQPTKLTLPPLNSGFLQIRRGEKVTLKMAETKIIYHIDEEETPYLVKIPIAAENITLLDFKQVLNKPNYKFFFKSMDQDFG